MKAKVLKDTTLTVKAGQIVDLDEKQYALALKQGRIEPFKEEKPKKKGK